VTAISQKWLDGKLQVIDRLGVYEQVREPLLTIERELAVWLKTDTNQVFLIYRRGKNDQVKLEMK